MTSGFLEVTEQNLSVGESCWLVDPGVRKEAVGAGKYLVTGSLVKTKNNPCIQCSLMVSFCVVTILTMVSFMWGHYMQIGKKYTALAHALAVAHCGRRNVCSQQLTQQNVPCFSAQLHALNIHPFIIIIFFCSSSYISPSYRQENRPRRVNTLSVTEWMLCPWLLNVSPLYWIIKCQEVSWWGTFECQRTTGLLLPGESQKGFHADASFSLRDDQRGHSKNWCQ